ncbi:hypothetical protein DSECCO2_521180 [anaerobic digester metagenome]
MTVTPVCLARSTRAVATARTWLTEPGSPSALDETMVWTESTTTRAGRSSMQARMSSAWLEAMAVSLPPSIPRRSARLRIWDRDSSPET